MNAIDGYLTCELCGHWGADVTSHRGIARCHVCKLVAEQRRSDADVAAGRLINVGADRHGAAVYARAENIGDMLALGALQEIGVQGDRTVYEMTDTGRKGADIPMGEGDVLVLGVLESLTTTTLVPCANERHGRGSRSARCRRWTAMTSTPSRSCLLWPTRSSVTPPRLVSLPTGCRSCCCRSRSFSARRGTRRRLLTPTST